MTESFQGIQDWARETFGNISTTGRIIERAGEEWAEMLEATGDDQVVEAADVIITLLNIEGLPEAINRKMEINRNRRWNVLGDGTAYHIKS